MNTPNHPATLRESIAAEIEWHRAEETEWREEEKLCPGGERPQCRFAAMEHKTAADRLEARLASHPEDGRGEAESYRNRWTKADARATAQDALLDALEARASAMGSAGGEVAEAGYWFWAEIQAFRDGLPAEPVSALPDVDEHEAGR